MSGVLWTFCYHDVEEFASSDMLGSHYVKISQIEEDLQVASDAGLEVVTRCGDYLSLCAGGNELDRDKVLLTFDDGYSSQVETLCKLGREKGVGAVVFVVVGSVGKRGYASWSALRDLANEGYGVQSHGYSHSVLTSLDWGSLKEEMKRSREELQERIGQVVWGLALPQGFYNTRVLLAASEEGYRICFTSRYGTGIRYHTRSSTILVPRIVARDNRIQKAIIRLRKPGAFRHWYEIKGGCHDSLKNLVGYRVVSVLWRLSHPE